MSILIQISQIKKEVQEAISILDVVKVFDEKFSNDEIPTSTRIAIDQIKRQVKGASTTLRTVYDRVSSLQDSKASFYFGGEGLALYKGAQIINTKTEGVYEVTGITHCSDSLNMLVTYVSSDKIAFTRPLSEFFELVERDGKLTYRFLSV